MQGDTGKIFWYLIGVFKDGQGFTKFLIWWKYEWSKACYFWSNAYLAIWSRDWSEFCIQGSVQDVLV